MYSDCGTNFVCANEELRKVLQEAFPLRKVLQEVFPKSILNC